MKSWKVLVAFVCLWAVGGYVWWNYIREPASPTGAAGESPMAPPPPGLDSWTFKTEQHWLVDEIGRDIAEMVLYAKDPAAPVSGALTFTATAPGNDGRFEFSAKAGAGEVKEPRTLAHHLWASENYTPWAKKLLDSWKLSAPAQATAPNTGLVKALTTPAQGLLVVEGQRISKELSQHPLDAELHEEAALVHGCLALREAAGQFYDARHSLCRMSAHLAMAEALRDKPSVCGQLAQVMQLSLIKRQTEAMEKIAQFPPELAPWSNALKMRCSFDWRMLPRPEAASLLEQMEYGRAMIHCLLTGTLVEVLQKINASRMPEWSRLVMEHSFSVEEGHLFAKESLGLELQDLAADWKSWSDKDLKEEGLVLIANDTPGRCVVKSEDGKQVMEVLGWGDLAAFHQRHICHSIQRTVWFLRDMWGVPEEDRKFEEAVKAHLAGLRLVPIVFKRCAQTMQPYASAMSASLDMCNKRPELVTASNWTCLREPAKLGNQNTRIPDPLAWFTPDLPFGTAYDFHPRYYDMHHLWQADTAFWDGLLAMAPFDYDVIRAHRHKKQGDKLSSGEVDQSFAKIRDYDVKAMAEVARFSEKDPPQHIAVLRKMSVLVPNYYIDLGSYLEEQHMDAEAAAAYQSAFEKAHDRVEMANTCDWIVNYYFDHGRKDDAVKIATEAAEVYSSRGLETMGKLMERMDKNDEAEKYYGNIAERYNDSGPLVGFYMRVAGTNPRYAAALKKITEEVYPDGVEKVTLANFSGAPQDGTVIMSTNSNTGRAHLKKGDVIVALDGYRVHTMEQYTWVRGLTRDPNMTIIVWNGSKHVEIKTSLPKRRFECQMITYQGR